MQPSLQADPLCDFDPTLSSALNVVSLDKPEVKCTVTWPDLAEVGEEAAQRLSPLFPAERFQLVMDPELSRDHCIRLEFPLSFLQCRHSILKDHISYRRSSTFIRNSC